MLLLTGLVLVVTGARDFAYAARLAGTPGTFQVLYGNRGYGNGRSSGSFHMVWHGTFTSADERVRDGRAVLQDEADGHRLTGRIPVTRAGAGTYYTARPNYALGWLSLGLAGGGLVATALPLLLFGRASRRPDRPGPRWFGTAPRVVWCCAVASGAAALVAAVVA
ncbi:hypothetical protein [Streptomyces carpinensis]|uniref:DUF3592 domain-containing protein n=1 Tax=Streptomyces carpinensis TaxID=66369 RepID=A0ABV1WEL1_9ACTN|nr:hypothetical protein [Streptomyces carpinensis]